MFLQPKITSFNTSYDDLCYHQMENHFDGTFLEKTNRNNSSTLGNFKNRKVNMHTTFINKILDKKLLDKI